MPAVSTLVIPSPLSSSNKATFVNWLKEQNSVIRLEFVNGPPDLAAIKDLFCERNANHDNPITALSFVKVQLDSSHFSILKEMIDGQVSELNFTGSLQGDLSSNFVSLLGTADCQRLTHLYVGQNPGLDVKSLFERLPNLQDLSLASCGLELAVLFDILKEPNAARLKWIDVSENQCTVAIPPTFVLPPALTYIRADRIEWTGQNFVHFWGGILTGASQAFTIQISDARMSDSDWEHFFASLSGLKSAFLEALVWTLNRTSDSFFGFLSRCEKLSTLDLTGSLIPSNNSLPALASFLSESTSLSDLNISGAPNRTLELSDLGVVLTSLETNRSIIRLSCKDHGIGPDFLCFLAGLLITNRRVAVIRLSGNNFTEFPVLQQFFGILAQRGVPLDVPWPKTSIDAILAARPNLAGDIRQLETVHKTVVSGNPSIRVPPESITVVPKAAAPPPQLSAAPPAPEPVPEPAPAPEPAPEPKHVRLSASSSAAPESGRGTRLRSRSMVLRSGFPKPQISPSRSANESGPSSRRVRQLTFSVPSRYEYVESRSPKTLPFTDIDPMSRLEDGETLVPLPVMPKLDNEFVPGILDVEFDLVGLLGAIRS